eukprot:315593-Ditylum_brightwellii.AAC.1
MLVKLSINMECSMWIDGPQRIVKFREAALPEIYKWLKGICSIHYQGLVPREIVAFRPFSPVELT